MGSTRRCRALNFAPWPPQIMLLMVQNLFQQQQRASSCLFAHCPPCSCRKDFQKLAPTSCNMVINAEHVSTGRHHCQQHLHLSSTFPPRVRISSCCSQQASNVREKKKKNIQKMTAACFTQDFAHWQKLQVAGCRGWLVPALCQATSHQQSNGWSNKPAFSPAWFSVHDVFSTSEAMIYPRDYPMSSLCQLRTVMGRKKNSKKPPKKHQTKMKQNRWQTGNSLRKWQRLIPPAFTPQGGLSLWSGQLHLAFSAPAWIFSNDNRTLTATLA